LHAMDLPAEAMAHSHLNTGTHARDYHE